MIITIIETNNLQANCVLLHIRSLLEHYTAPTGKDATSFASLSLKPYANGREHGFNLTENVRCRNYNLSVSFSEYRNTDQIVTYPGTRKDFSSDTFIPNEKVYKAAIFYKCGEYEKAAKGILDYLLLTE